MVEIVNSIDAFFDDYFNINIPDMGIFDAIEIVIIAYFVYHLLVWIKNSRAWMLIRGVIAILMFFGLAALLQMNTILWLGEKMVSVAVIALLVVFQPELRRALEQIGRRKLTSNIFSFGTLRASGKKFEDATIAGMVTACYEMGAVKTGALIVVENEMQLTEFERTGIPIDSLVSRQLLINIFEKNTPLHDGAIIVRGDRIVSATCYLPLSDDMGLSKELGTRHRAAVGIREVSDSLTIVVSEETGHVSYAKDGKVFRNVREEDLIRELRKIQMPDYERDDDPAEEKAVR